MGILAQLERPVDRPAMVTICGEAGVGKTSLAALFPNPVVIRTEDGLQSVVEEHRPMAFPVASDYDTVISQVNALGAEDHDYKTLIIDSVTKLNKIIETEIVASDGRATNINTALGGYGAGQRGVAEQHAHLKFLCDQLVFHKGMNICLIAHAEVDEIALPDQDPFNQYTVRMHKHSRQMYLDDVDMVAFIKLKTLTRSNEDDKRARATSTGQRIITCHKVANHQSKNRYGISKDLDFKQGTNPFDGIIPSLSTQTATNEPV